MSCVKGIFMFTVILLIGSGWSLIKPVLGDREKKIIWIVLVLQVIDNLAVAILSQETEGEKRYEDWSALLHLVDILCCCAILIPIVWQVNSLENIVEAEAMNSNQSIERNRDNGKTNVITDVESEAPATAIAARSLRNLKQFQRFYILVVLYVYFTRIVVYLFASMLSYKLTWLRYLVTELATLVFYIVVGILFRPTDDNPYLQANAHADDGTEIEFAGGR
jgi:NADH:ubiquinone oxidoreductase subunit 3 (subunit A)